MSVGVAVHGDVCGFGAFATSEIANARSIVADRYPVQISTLAKKIDEWYGFGLQRWRDRHDPQRLVWPDKKHPHGLQIDDDIVQDNGTPACNYGFAQTSPKRV